MPQSSTICRQKIEVRLNAMNAGVSISQMHRKWNPFVLNVLTTFMDTKIAIMISETESAAGVLGMAPDRRTLTE